MKHARLFLVPALAALLHAAASAAPLQVTTATGGNSLGASLSHDGSRIAFQSFETRGTTGPFRSLHHDVATQQTVAPNDHTAQFQPTDIGRDGRLIALNHDNDGLRIVDTATGLTGPLPAFNPAALSMSGDGSRIAADGLRGGVRLIDAGTGSALQISPEGSGSNQTPDLSGEGLVVACTSNGDFTGQNPGRVVQIFVDSLAARANGVPVPSSLLLAGAALGWLARRRPTLPAGGGADAAGTGRTTRAGHAGR